MSAQIAVQAGEVAGRNAVALLTDGPLETVRLSHRGWVMDLGGWRGLAEFGPISLSAPFFDLLPPLLHWGIDVKHLIDTRGLGGLVDAPG
jgi:NADH dehydrogenase